MTTERQQQLKRTILLRTLAPAIQELKALAQEAGKMPHDQLMRRYLDCYGALYAAGRLAEVLVDRAFGGVPEKATLTAAIREPVDQMMDRLADQVLGNVRGTT